MPSLTLASVGFDRSPTLGAPASSITNGNGGAVQAYSTGLWRSDVGFDRSPAWGPILSSVLVGAGGTTQVPPTALWTSDVTYDRSPRSVRLAFDFSWVVASLVKEPIRVDFTAFTTPGSGLSIQEPTWYFGDSADFYLGNPIRWDYTFFGKYTVTLVALLDPLGIYMDVTHLVDLTDPSGEPVETLDEILNLEIGHHAYEPVRTAASTTSESLYKEYNTVVANAGAEAVVLDITAPYDVQLDHIPIGGDADGEWRLEINGIEYLPRQLTSVVRPSGDFLNGARHRIAAGERVRIVVRNAAASQGRYSAFMTGVRA